MSLNRSDIDQPDEDLPGKMPGPAQTWLATGGLIGAVLASSCCVIPFALISLGISGAWIGTLSALEPLKPLFATVTIALIAAGFWHVYFRKPEECKDGSYCARPGSSRLTKSALWLATAIVLIALTIDFWAPLFY